MYKSPKFSNCSVKIKGLNYVLQFTAVMYMYVFCWKTCSDEHGTKDKKLKIVPPTHKHLMKQSQNFNAIIF